MKAKFVNEAFKDVFKPKSQSEIDSVKNDFLNNLSALSFENIQKKLENIFGQDIEKYNDFFSKEELNKLKQILFIKLKPIDKKTLSRLYDILLTNGEVTNIELVYDPYNGLGFTFNYDDDVLIAYDINEGSKTIPLFFYTSGIPRWDGPPIEFIDDWEGIRDPDEIDGHEIYRPFSNQPWDEFIEHE